MYVSVCMHFSVSRFHKHLKLERESDECGMGDNMVLHEIPESQHSLGNTVISKPNLLTVDNAQWI